jgi:O-antigen/teichoic acid export membrane protein
MTDESDVSFDEDTSPLPARASIRRNVFHMLSSQLFTWTLATVLAVVVPRYVGTDTQGQLRLATSLWTIGGIFVAMGTSEYLRLEIARTSRNGLRYVGPVLVIRTLSFLVTSIAIGIYVVLAESDRSFVLIVTFVGGAMLIGTWSDVIGAAFVGMERMTVPAIGTAATKLLLAVGVLAVILADGGAYGILAVGLVVGLCGLGWISWKFRETASITVRGWMSVSSRIMRASVPFMAAGAALVIYQQIDVVVISWVAGDSALGWYSTADALFGSLLFPATIVMGTVFPTMGRLHQDDPEALTVLLKRAFEALVLVAVPIGLGTTLIATRFAPILYGEAYRKTGPVLAVLGPVIILTFGTILFGTVALATGRNRLWVRLLLGCAALTVLLDLLLVPWADDRFANGAIGGAIAYTITEFIQLAVGIWKIAPFVARRPTVWYTGRVLLAGGIMFTIGLLLRNLPLPVLIAGCSVVYVIAIFGLRVVTRDQRRIVTDVLSRLGVGRGLNT